MIYLKMDEMRIGTYPPESDTFDEVDTLDGAQRTTCRRPAIAINQWTQHIAKHRPRDGFCLEQEMYFAALGDDAEIPIFGNFPIDQKELRGQVPRDVDHAAALPLDSAAATCS